MPETVPGVASPSAQLKKLGITLPPLGKPLASYVPFVRTGNLIFISGQLPMKDGKPAFTGKLGRELTIEQGKEAAKLCAINALAVLQEAAGGLDRIRRIVRVAAHVNSAPGFTDPHQVANGASDFLALVFGENGRHSRLALGAAELPLNAAFELDVIAEV